MSERAPLSPRELSSRKYQLLVMFAALGVAAGLAIYFFRPPEQVDLTASERSVFSQRGEDGVIERIFEIIPPGPRYAVEFGASDGVTLSNTRNLIVNHGWSALLMEGDDDLARRAAENYRNHPQVKAIQAWIYPGNIELLLEENGVPRDFDLISIDIDSNDYYVWKVMHEFRPKVVLIEYNAGFPPPQKAVIEFHPMSYFDRSDYFGASIQSLYELGKRKGYELVHCESRGVNLFFVDEKYFRRFGLKDNSPSRLYRMPAYGGQLGRAANGRGWPAWDRLVEKPDGTVERPFANDLVWDEVRIQKKWALDR